VHERPVVIGAERSAVERRVSRDETLDLIQVRGIDGRFELGGERRFIGQLTRVAGKLGGDQPPAASAAIYAECSRPSGERTLVNDRWRRLGPIPIPLAPDTLPVPPLALGCPRPRQTARA
jgi:hypothetical protein